MKKTAWVLLALIIGAAFFLRYWRLDEIPPGWRDDELINSLVISQKVLDGDWAVYYPDASGHEALYHALSAVTLGLFGPGTAGIRWLPALLGTLTIPLTFAAGSRLFGRKTGILASAALAVSFWSLMYSRIGLRHISLPVLMLGAFICFLRGLGMDASGMQPGPRNEEEKRKVLRSFAVAGLLMGLSFYTYFASRGLPFILLAFLVYLFLFHRKMLAGRWWGLAAMFLIAFLMALPLLGTLARQPESEARVEELAVPLSRAANGDFSLLVEHVVRTLNMYHSDGDDEWLYNIPYRPVFGLPGALFFWAGVVTAAWYALRPLWRLARREKTMPEEPATSRLEAGGAFTLIWWLAGLSPAFVSVPAASLGHTIIAQSASYIIMALPMVPISRSIERQVRGKNVPASLVLAGIGLLLVAGIALRDLPDYFANWPERGMTRFLYRAEIQEAAEYLLEHEELSDFGISGLLAGPWDKLALEIGLNENERYRGRWYQAERAVLLSLAGETAYVFEGYPPVERLYPDSYDRVPDERAGAYFLSRMREIEPPNDLDMTPTCFVNGLCLLSANYEEGSGHLDLIWEVREPLDLPEIPLVSNPPPPDTYAGSRLLVFAQLLDQNGEYLGGDDGLWVDPATLWQGDRFLQQHRLGERGGSEKEAAASVAFGLYDPMTGERIMTLNGSDQLRLEIR